MMWQDLVFTAGSALSIVFLAPTLRDMSASVPLGTSLPSMGVGAVYSFTFLTLGMTFSAIGAGMTAIMWSLIATYRSPGKNRFVSAATDAETIAAHGRALTGILSRYTGEFWDGMTRYGPEYDGDPERVHVRSD